jgi:hypothetical protein
MSLSLVGCISESPGIGCLVPKSGIPAATDIPAPKINFVKIKWVYEVFIYHILQQYALHGEQMK